MNIRWIPGRKNGMLPSYFVDPASRKAVLICDIVSLVSLAVLILSPILIYVLIISPGNVNGSLGSILAGLFVGSIAVMVIVSLIRRRYKIR